MRIIPYYKAKNIGLQVNISLYRSLVISNVLYGCEIWTTIAETEGRIQAIEMKCLREKTLDLLPTTEEQWVGSPRGGVNMWKTEDTAGHCKKNKN